MPLSEEVLALMLLDLSSMIGVLTTRQTSLIENEGATMMKPSHTIILLLLFLGPFIFLGCVQPAPTPSTPATIPVLSPELEQEIDSLKSQLEEAQEELASYKLREQNWEYWENIGALLQKTSMGVSEIRELSAPEQVGFRVVTADWAKEKWGEEYVKENFKKIEIDERIFKGLFILPDTVSLADLYAEWPRSYLLAKLEDKVYFVQENFGKLNGQEARKALAHEVVHLLQGKHFETPELAIYDEEKAWSALIEGDADFSRTKYLEEIAQVEPIPEIGKLPNSFLGSAPELERPQAFTKLLYFPYDYGESFVSQLFQRGGWQEVNEAYRKPPVTTEQIIHPEKYLTDEGPRSIDALPFNIVGWQEERSDRLGEYFIKVMLETWLPEPEADSAARGWGGDRLTYYEWQEAYLFAWQTVWDSNQDAAEFYAAFLEMLEEVDATQVGPNLWLGQSEYLWVRKTDDQGVLIIASKERSMIDAVLDAR